MPIKATHLLSACENLQSLCLGLETSDVLIYSPNCTFVAIQRGILPYTLFGTLPEFQPKGRALFNVQRITALTSSNNRGKTLRSCFYSET